MKFRISKYDDAQRVLFKTVKPRTIVWDLVWDLDDWLDHHDVPVRLDKCQDCGKTIVHYPYELIDTKCPHCGKETMELAIEVDMIIQGDIVMYRKGDE